MEEISVLEEQSYALEDKIFELSSDIQDVIKKGNDIFCEWCEGYGGIWHRLHDLMERNDKTALVCPMDFGNGHDIELLTCFKTIHIRKFFFDNDTPKVEYHFVEEPDNIKVQVVGNLNDNVLERLELVLFDIYKEALSLLEGDNTDSEEEHIIARIKAADAPYNDFYINKIKPIEAELNVIRGKENNILTKNVSDIFNKYNTTALDLTDLEYPVSLFDYDSMYDNESEHCCDVSRVYFVNDELLFDIKINNDSDDYDCTRTYTLPELRDRFSYPTKYADKLILPGLIKYLSNNAKECLDNMKRKEGA